MEIIELYLASNEFASTNKK